MAASNLEHPFIKEQICYYSDLLWQKGYADGNGGNISVKIDNDKFFVTPSLFSKKGLKPEDIVTVDSDGCELDKGNRASSEFSTHLAVYRKNPDIKAVIHAHPPYICSFACTDNFPVEPLTPEAYLWAGEIAVIPYLLPGSALLAEYIENLSSKGEVLILKNHGVITSGKSLRDAWFRCEVVEHQSFIYHLAKSRNDELNKLDLTEAEKLDEIKRRIIE